MNATPADLVLARLESQEGRRAWSRGITQGTPRALRLLEAVQSATGLTRYEDIGPVMKKVDTLVPTDEEARRYRQADEEERGDI
jgi:hypothetical protein